MKKREHKKRIKKIHKELSSGRKEGIAKFKKYHKEIGTPKKIIKRRIAIDFDKWWN